jgi:hypothetical protein
MPAALARHPLLCVLAAALALRLVAAFGVQAYLDRTGRDFLIPGDAEGYWMLAGKIVAGRDYSVYDPPRRVLRMPGFPLLLAAIRAVTGDAFLPVRVVLAGTGTAACGAVYLLGRILDSERTGLIAAALAAAWPVLVGFSVLVLSESFFALMLVLSLAAMAKLVTLARSPAAVPRRGVLLWSAVVGMSVVLASYVRPTWLPAAGLFPAGYWFAAGRTRDAALAGTVVLFAAAVALAPWTIRNWFVTGHIVPTTLWVGPSLYDGLRPGATGESDMRFFDDENLLGRMSEYDMDREYRRRAWASVRENPGEAVRLAFVKFWRYVRPWPGAEQFSSIPARLAVAAYYAPAVVLAAFGAWSRRADLWLLSLSVGPFILFALVHCVFVSSLRYRLPAEYPLCVLSAVGVQTLLRRAPA